MLERELNKSVEDIINNPLSAIGEERVVERSNDRVSKPFTAKTTTLTDFLSRFAHFALPTF